MEVEDDPMGYTADYYMPLNIAIYRLNALYLIAETANRFPVKVPLGSALPLALPNFWYLSASS
jgi:hypothetical protein